MKPTYRPPVRTEDRIRAQLTLSLVSSATGLWLDPPGPRRPTLPVLHGRWTAVYLAYIVFEWSLERVSDAFGINRSTAARACRWTEEARDRPAFDQLLDRLERHARDLATPIDGALA